MEPTARILKNIDWDFVDTIRPNLNFVVQDESGGYWGCTELPYVEPKLPTWTLRNMSKDHLWTPTEMWQMVGSSRSSKRMTAPLQGLFPDWVGTLSQVEENEWIGMSSNGAWHWYYLKPQELRFGFFLNANGSCHPISVVDNWQDRLFTRPGYDSKELAW